MISVSQNWKEKMGCYLMPNRERLAPEQLIKLEYNIDDETLIFDKSNITSFTHKQSCDLNSLTLPKNEIQFEIDNSDGRWNPDSPTGMYQKITEKQKVDLYYGVMINGVAEWYKAGTFYMSGWDTPQNGLTATFTATSQLDFGKDKFGEVSYATAPTMFDVCFSALVHMGMDPNHTSDFAKLDNILRNYSVPYKSGTTYTVDMFKNTTDAAVIQLCANAAMCRIRYNTAGKIYVEPMTLTGVELGDYTIDPFVSYRNAEYTMSKQIKNVLINNNLTVAIAEQGENQQISNNLITTQLHANQFGGWLAGVINTRKEVNGEYRGDPRLQLYDYVKIINKYAVNEAFITAITYTFNGSFKGTYEGRVMKSISSADLYGNYYAGDHNKANSTIS